MKILAVICMWTCLGQPNTVVKNGEAVEALQEVNDTRAKRGLPPFKKVASLTQAALKCSKFRAERLCQGHTSNDFAFLPPESFCEAAGCAAWTPDWGWGACCTYERWTYAGAAWTMGRDGRRYMHLFISNRP